MRKEGKANLFTTTRARIIKQFTTDLWYSYCSKTLTYKEYRELLDLMRDKLSNESVIGIKQMSIFDTLTDEDIISMEDDK